jgi:hypothetical protein
MNYTETRRTVVLRGAREFLENPYDGVDDDPAMKAYYAVGVARALISLLIDVIEDNPDIDLLRPEVNA